MGCCASAQRRGGQDVPGFLAPAGDAGPAGDALPRPISRATLVQEEKRRAADALSTSLFGRGRAGKRPPAAPEWTELGGKALEPLLKHTSLVDAEFLVALADAGGVVPRWQELPEAAKVGPANAWQLRCGAKLNFLPILVLSYPWFDRSHPDRLGETLQRVAPVLRTMLNRAKEGRLPHATVGVVWDFPSLPQKPHRNNSERKRFKAGLKAIDQWYAHPFTTVLLVTNPVPPGDGTYENRRAYQNRGWCKFERTISGLTKDFSCLLDLGQAPDGWAPGDYHRDVVSVLRASRLPPVSPNSFAEQVRAGVREGTVAFTAGAVDEEFVIEQYRKGFVQAYDGYRSITDLHGDIWLTCLGWGDEEAAVLAEAIAYAVEHCAPPGPITFWLSANAFSEAGRAALRRAQGGPFSTVGLEAQRRAAQGV